MANELIKAIHYLAQWTLCASNSFCLQMLPDWFAKIFESNYKAFGGMNMENELCYWILVAEKPSKWKLAEDTTFLVTCMLQRRFQLANYPIYSQDVCSNSIKTHLKIVSNVLVWHAFHLHVTIQIKCLFPCSYLKVMYILQVWVTDSDTYYMHNLEA